MALVMAAFWLAWAITFAVAALGYLFPHIPWPRRLAAAGWICGVVGALLRARDWRGL